MIDMMQKFCRGRRLGVPFSVYLYTWFGLPGVRVSGGHLCEAEAPTEPAGETVSPYNSSNNFCSTNYNLYNKLFCTLHLYFGD